MTSANNYLEGTELGDPCQIRDNPLVKSLLRELSVKPEEIASLPEQSRTRFIQAVSWRSAGLSLLPLSPESKEPETPLLPEGSTNLLRKRPATVEDIKDWFQSVPDMNLGIFTGEASGWNEKSLVVLDWDVEISPDLGLPETATVKTTKGEHRYYLVEGDINSKACQSLDIQGDLKYVVSPGSLHPSGKEYELTGAESLTDQIETITRAELGDVYEYVENQKEPDETVQELPNMDLETRSDDWKELANDEAVVKEVMENVGIEWPGLKKSFCCPLPGHNEKNPSASFFRGDRKFKGEEKNPFIGMRDFHHPEDPNWWPIPDVYKAIETGRLDHLNMSGQNGRRQTGTRRIWWLRALDESGIIERPERIGPQLPDDYPENAKKILEGFRYLLELRAIHDNEQKASPYSYRFIMDWVGIGSPNTVSKWMEKLMEDEYIQVHEERKLPKPNLLKLGGF